jgi:putative NADH-flavin reductase
MTKSILILGATGHLGKVLTKILLSKNYKVVALVRNPEKFDSSLRNIKIIKGSVLDEKDLQKSLEGIDAVISVLGHGFRTSFPIQEKVMKILIPLMESNGIDRLITITGEALIVSSDNKSLRADITSNFLKIIDPYRMNDAIAQQKIIEKSSLDWTVVRTPIHSNKGTKKVLHIGMTHPPIWQTVNRIAVCEFINDCLVNDSWIKKSPIVF